MTAIEAEEYVQEALQQISSDHIEFADFLIIAGEPYKQENIEREAIKRAAKGLTKAQLHIFRTVFDKHDPNNRNSISVLKFEGMLKELGENISKDQIRNFIDDCNDENGEFTYPQFLRFLGDRWRLIGDLGDDAISSKYNLTILQVEKIRKIFSHYDDDNNGVVELQYLNDILIQLGEHFTKYELRDIIDNAKLQSNTEITFIEILLMLSTLWSKKNEQAELKEALYDLTMVQAAKIKKVFYKYDTNHSNTVNTSYLKDILKDMEEDYSTQGINLMMEQMNIQDGSEIN